MRGVIIAVAAVAVLLAFLGVVLNMAAQAVSDQLDDRRMSESVDRGDR